MHNGYVRKLLGVAGLALVAACGGDDGATPQGPPVVSDRLSVNLTPDRDSILFGTTRQYTATVTNQFGAERQAAVTWSSTNAEVASVTNAGLVTAIGAGSVQIVATITGHADTSAVTVYGSPAPLLIVPDAVNLNVGDDITLQASLGDSTAGAGSEVTWETSDSTLATVAADGTVTGVEAGEVTLTAKLGAATATAKVSVQAANIATISITPTVNSISPGATVKLTATARSATGRRIEAVFAWSSSNTTVATVNSKGLVTGKARGYAIISAAAGTKRGSVSVNVGPPPVTSVKATLPDSSILEAQVLQASATARDSAGNTISGATIAWQSSNPAIATVTSTGRVTGIVAGNVNIIALSGGKTATIPVVVSKRAATSIDITPDAPAVGVGTTAALTASVLDQNGSPMSGIQVSWSSSNAAIATVNASGVVSGVALGQATITARAGALQSTVLVTVGAAPVATISVSPASLNADIGDQPAFFAVLRDADGNVLSGRSISWTSSDPLVATVSVTGVATGVAEGTTTITATSEGKSATATLTIDPPPAPGIAQVTVTLNSGTLNVGQTTQAAAVATDDNGNTVAAPVLTWSSSDPTIASVNGGGIISAVSGGTATIMASVGGVTGAASITVNAAAPAAVASVTVALTPTTTTAGATAQATVVLRDSAGNVLTGRSYGLSSDKPTIATVNTSGLVTAVSAGLTNIRATSGGKMGFRLFKVTSGAPVIASVVVDAPTTQMDVGDTQTATAVALDASGDTVSTGPFAWTSSAPTILSVSSGGQLTAIAAGSATITAVTSGVAGTLGFTVQNNAPAPVASVSVSLAASSIKVGQTTQGTAVTKDANGKVLTGRPIAWSSSNTAVATVASNGVVTAVGTGSASISATSGSASGSASVSVTASTPASLTVSLAAPTLAAGQTTTATSIVKDNQGNVLPGIAVSYSSSNSAVATVNATTGAVSAVSQGSANIIGTASGVSGSATLTVQAPLPVASAHLPRVTPSVPSNLTSLPCTVHVPAGGLQPAINAARGGSVLCLTGTHTGNFTVPPRTDAGWVVIRNAGAVPSGRMRPSLATGIAKLVSTNVLPAIQFNSRSVRTLVYGLEITSSSNLTTLAPVSLVLVGNGTENQLSELPNDIAFQSLYVHGWPGAHIRRGFTLNGAAQSIRDSWCDEIHASGYDSQCSISWNSSGPILIENNTLKAASENIMFGGADPKIANNVTSDVTIRRNHIAKPIGWKGGGWNVKNLIETKASARVLVEENVLEGSWTDGQVGYAFVLKSSNQNGACRRCGTSDWTIRRNLVRNVGAGFSIAGRADQQTYATDSTNRRFEIAENWFEPINVAPYNGDGRLIIFVAENHDFTVRGNVFEGGNNNAALLMDISNGNWAVKNLAMMNNVLARGQYGVFATATGEGLASWTKAALGSSSWTSMAMVGSTRAAYPSGTQWHSGTASAVSAGMGVSRNVVDAGVLNVVIAP
ncbi:MAG: Ig-like domain-containing protein [Gemmatimonadaceae bacterium]|nr:Ig-like domain-containing protein [Gemmatimonadaceae bacterium]